MAWLTKWSFQHGGRTYKPGDVVQELPETVAARLIELKAIEPQAQAARGSSPLCSDQAAPDQSGDKGLQPLENKRSKKK